jgi:ABC-type multidrug transport system ATPase subunit
MALASGIRSEEWLRAMRGLRRLDPIDWSAAASSSGMDPELLFKRSGSISKGSLQRVALLEALHSEAGLLLLDEPFSALDERGRDWLAEMLRRRVTDGAALVLSDHSRAMEGRLAVDARWRLHGGSAHLEDVESEVGAPSVTIVAMHPDARRLRRTVADHEVDDCLRALLDEGWHIHRVSE